MVGFEDNNKHGFVYPCPPKPHSMWGSPGQEDESCIGWHIRAIGDHSPVITRGLRIHTRTWTYLRNVLRERGLTQDYILGNFVYTKFYSR